MTSFRPFYAIATIIFISVVGLFFFASSGFNIGHEPEDLLADTPTHIKESSGNVDFGASLQTPNSVNSCNANLLMLQDILSADSFSDAKTEEPTSKEIISANNPSNIKTTNIDTIATTSDNPANETLHAYSAGMNSTSKISSSSATANAVSTSSIAGGLGIASSTKSKTYRSYKLKNLFSSLPPINPAYSPLDERNKNLLATRFTNAFDIFYETYFDDSRNFADNMKAYYLRQELQALIDMYRATNNNKYLEQARQVVRKAISDATTNSKVLLYHHQTRGYWPCFLMEGVIAQTGGHSQLNDFQGAAGFMMVASVLKQANMDGWQDIAEFVEKKIVEKWLSYKPTLSLSDFTDEQSRLRVLFALDKSRDKREHFASICLDLHELEYDKYPYEDWGKFLVQIYLTERTNLSQPYPAPEYRRNIPVDWGLYRQNNTLIWYWGTLKSPFTILDTNHANRTIWLSAYTYEKELISVNTINGLINTFKENIWTPQKSPFYFKNMIDGSDPVVQRLGPGLKGNVWFGWHRLAAYDDSLKELFISLGYDLTNGGPNINNQNKGMQNAPLCLIAWAARLISGDGQPTLFP